MIVQISLICALLSVFPVLLSVYGVEVATLWLICSVLCVIATVSVMYGVNRNMRGAVKKKSLRLLFKSMQGGAALVVLFLILNASDVVFHREPGPYITTIVYGLSLVGYMFTRLLLRPLWRVVKEQEAANPGGA